MHPKSKDRSGNEKLIADTNADKAKRPIAVGGRGRGRQSPYARKLEAMRQVRAIKEMIKEKEAEKAGEEE